MKITLDKLDNTNIDDLPEDAVIVLDDRTPKRDPETTALVFPNDPRYEEL